MTRLQVALDFLTLDAAVALATQLARDVDLVEAGTPLIKRYGMAAVTALHKACPQKPIVADLKTMDAGAFEARLALDAGAQGVTVLGCADDATIAAMVDVTRTHGGQLVVDLINVADKPARAAAVAALGADAVCVHAGADVQALGHDAVAELAALHGRPACKLVVAGGIHPANLAGVLAHHPDVVVVGGAITGAANPAEVVASLRRVLDAAGQ